MTRTTNARIAGFAFLIYIAAGVTSLVVFRNATSGDGIAARLATLASHASDVAGLTLLGLVECFSAIVLGVTLYAITRDEDQDLAMLGLVCRAGEGIIAGVSVPTTSTLFWLATSSGPNAPTPDVTHALAAYLLRGDVALTATFFAAGSMSFAYLLLRGRMIPVPLGWIGVVASVLLVVGLPLRLAGLLHEPIASAMWLPMLAFEVPLAVWFLTKGVSAPRAR